MQLSVLNRHLVASALLCAAVAHCSAQAPVTFEVNEEATRLNFPGDHFQLALAVTNENTPTKAQVTSELLDVDDTVRSRAITTCDLYTGQTFCQLDMPPATPKAKTLGTEGNLLPLFRVHYTIEAPSDPPVSGILALDHVAPDLFDLHVAAPKDVHHGATYTARVRALHPLTHLPKAGVALDATFSASFENGDKEQTEFSHVHAVTDAEGFASISFTVPSESDLTAVDLDISATLANLRITTTQTLSIPDNDRFDLTTDKPLYQPGQIVHTRLLLLDRNGRASAEKKVRVDITDQNDTLVFRAEALTSGYGIATVDWPVPVRMRLGQYQLQASLPNDTDNHQSASASLRLSRYDLPTFVVAPTTDRPFYVPGSNAVVEVRANYLFGKSVLHGHVRVVRENERTWNFIDQRYDTKEGKAVSGEFDTLGIFRTHIPLVADLKQYLHSYASDQYDDLHFAAYVTDASTQRTEQRRFDVRIAAQAIHLYIVRGEQVKGLPQQLYLAATTADGSPVECDLALSLLPYEAEHDTLLQRIRRAHLLQHLHTDPNGLARLEIPTYEELLKLVPAPSRPVSQTSERQPTLFVSAHDKEGHTGAFTEDIPRPTGAFRITTPNSIYRPGDPIDIQIAALESSLPLTVQILRHTLHGDLTLDTREVSLINGHASLSVTSDERYTGFVSIEVIAMSPKASEPTRYGNYNGSNDPHVTVTPHVLLFPRDNTLKIGIRMSSETFAPGDQASASLKVTGPQDQDGDDRTQAPSALGIVAVDQAAEERNRTDTDFGGANPQPFFFQWRSEFEDNSAAGGFTLQSLERLDLTKPLPPGAQLAAEILLANLRLQIDIANNSEGGELGDVFRRILDAQLGPTRSALARYLNIHTELPTTKPEIAAIVANGGIDFDALRDPWGTPYRIAAVPESTGTFTLTLHSDGPDKFHATADDFEIPLTSWRWFAGHELELKHAVTSFHERSGRFIRNLADLRVAMHADGVAFDQWRDPWGQPYAFRFSIEGTQFVVSASSVGDPNYQPEYEFQKGPYIEGRAEIDYTTESRRRIEAALGRYAASHSYPVNTSEFIAALRLSDINPSQLTDPWRRPLSVTFRNRSIYTDRVQTEAHASPNGAPKNRTTIIPVTAISDIVELRSLGADGKRGTPDDFIFATFSRVRSLQGAQDSIPKHSPHQTVHSGQTGDIAGTLTDQTGAVIPGAIIVAINQKTGMEFEGKSDNEGNYLIGPLPVGTYKVQFQVRGFMNFVYDQVSLIPQATVTLDATLRVGSVSETVEVNASPMMLRTDSAMISTQQVTVMSSMAKMAPGIAPPPPPPTASTPRLRDYFPETLVWRPEIITAPDGTATLQFPVADSITTWQLSAAASTVQGNIGSGTAQFRSFQPFFAAFDPPSILTTGDAIALPITIRNYLDHPVSVQSSLRPAPWFRLDGPASRTTQISSQASASPVFRFTALTPVSNGQQQFTAQAGEVGDRIARPVTVHPDGEQIAMTVAGILSPGDNTLTLTLPGDTLPASSDTTLKVYPNLGAHLREALVAMADYPNGCAEQTISTAWASLLLQRYAAAVPQKDEKLQQQTRRNLEEAYENLLADQLSNGGFAYWSKDRYADLALTAYAVQFLAEARQFITVDEGVLNKAVAFLAQQQQPKTQTNAGLWVRVDRDHTPHPEDSRDNAMLTASIAAMIAGAPNSEPLLQKAIAAIEPFTDEYDEPYTLASYALAALALKDKARAEPAIKRLRALALSQDGGAYWSIETNTPFYGWGRAGQVEATAQVLHALLASGAQPQDDLVARGLLFLDHKQDRDSLWYSTQATARVLDVLAEIALRNPSVSSEGSPGNLTVRVDSQSAISIPLPPIAQEAGPIFVPLGAALAAGNHQVSLDLPKNSQSATAQLVSRLYRPWAAIAPISSIVNSEQLRMTVAFGTTAPLPEKQVDVTAHFERIGFQGYGMMIGEIGLPPGADVDRASLESAIAGSDYQLNQYEVLPDKVLVYLWPKAGGLTLHFHFTLRYVIDALAAPSSVYDYYNPDARFDAKPARFKTR